MISNNLIQYVGSKPIPKELSQDSLAAFDLLLHFNQRGFKYFVGIEKIKSLYQQSPEKLSENEQLIWFTLKSVNLFTSHGWSLSKMIQETKGKLFNQLLHFMTCHSSQELQIIILTIIISNMDDRASYKLERLFPEYGKFYQIVKQLIKDNDFGNEILSKQVTYLMLQLKQHLLGTMLSFNKLGNTQLFIVCTNAVKIFKNGELSFFYNHIEESSWPEISPIQYGFLDRIEELSDDALDQNLDVIKENIKEIIKESPIIQTAIQQEIKLEPQQDFNYQDYLITEEYPIPIDEAIEQNCFETFEISQDILIDKDEQNYDQSSPLINYLKIDLLHNSLMNYRQFIAISQKVWMYSFRKLDKFTSDKQIKQNTINYLSRQVAYNLGLTNFTLLTIHNILRQKKLTQLQRMKLSQEGFIMNHFYNLIEEFYQRIQFRSTLSFQDIILTDFPKLRHQDTETQKLIFIILTHIHDKIKIRPQGHYIETFKDPPFFRKIKIKESHPQDDPGSPKAASNIDFKKEQNKIEESKSP